METSNCTRACTEAVYDIMCEYHHNIAIEKAAVKRDKKFLELLEKSMDGQITLEGKKKDDGKPRWELVAYDAIEGIAKVLTFGANKYSARNWEKGIAYGRVYGAIMRHMWKWWHGEDKDAETGLSHLDHAMCELMFLSAYEKRAKNGTAQDDRPNTLHPEN